MNLMASTPAELATVALLLRHSAKNKTDPADYLPAAAALLSEAYSYYQRVNDAYYESISPQEKTLNQSKYSHPPVISTGQADQYLTLEQACKHSGWSLAHLRACLKSNLEPHHFHKIWQGPTEKMRIPKTAFDLVLRKQKIKRSHRSNKAAQAKK